MRSNLPPHQIFIGKTVPGRDDLVISEYMDSGCNGHVFKVKSPQIEISFACKIVPAPNLEGHRAKTWLEEARKPNQLDNRAVVKCNDVTSWNPDDIEGEFAIFLYEYVPGISLRQYISKNKNEVTISFIEEYLRTILSLLWEMEDKSIPHGDLHEGNVIVAERYKYDPNARESFRVTDFGVSAAYQPNAEVNDRLMVAQTLRRLLENTKYPSDARSRYLFDILRNDFLGRYLIETDHLVSPVTAEAGQMLQALSNIDSDFNRKKATTTTTRFTDPFEYPSCEQMGHSNLLLKALYSEQFLGLRQIEGPNNLVLTGPRGCGKTTVFRALSLDYKLSVKEDDPDLIRYIGVYYRCDNLYFTFPRFRESEHPEATDVPMHYIVTTLLYQLLSTIESWANRHYKEEFERQETRLTEALWRNLNWTQPSEPGSHRLERLLARLDKERGKAAKRADFLHDKKRKLGINLGPQALISSCEILRRELSFLVNRPIYLFIDDYSSPKVSFDLQRNLNRLFMHRSSDAFFKVSTESPVSYIRSDIDGKDFVEGREFELVNLGLEYISDTKETKLSFLEDLFGRRFKKVKDYPIKTLDQLLGDFPRVETEIARKIRKKSKKPINYGKQTLAALFSGDIHYMIRLVGRMVDACVIETQLSNTHSSSAIPIEIQHTVIRKSSGDFLEQVRRLPRYGSKLADIVTAFGNVAYSHLLHSDSKNVNGSPPHQASRIEPYGALNLSPEAEDLYNELLRYSIFLEDPRGKSRRGEVVPRLYLRRILIPHFNLTFSRRDSIEVEGREFENLLVKPDEFEYDRRSKKSKDTLTSDLFQEQPSDEE